MTRTLRPALLTAASLLAAAASPAADAPRVVVGPNILVSRDGDVAHCETMIAANPKDPKNLLGGSIVMARPDGGAANKAYVSFDGGATWEDVVIPLEMSEGSGDPQVGFGASGTAYFVGLSDGMVFYRSEDGGKTWGLPIRLGKGHDHEMLVTDLTTGPYAGRVYITDETDQKGSNEIEDLIMRRRVVLFRSSDDGRSWTGPVDVALGEGKGLAAYNLLILSDGTLVAPMMEYPNYGIDKEASSWRMVFVTSSDGGVTFTPKKPITEVYFGGLKAMREQQKSGRVDGISGPVFGVDSGEKFRDRLYAAWAELDGGRFRVKSSFSSDRGATWSKPKPIDASAPAGASEYLPVIAVNADGVLGVFYYSTEGFPKRDRSHGYFAASMDGGETFLPKVRVSSQVSHPFGSGNLRPGPARSGRPGAPGHLDALRHVAVARRGRLHRHDRRRQRCVPSLLSRRAERHLPALHGRDPGHDRAPGEAAGGGEGRPERTAHARLRPHPVRRRDARSRDAGPPEERVEGDAVPALHRLRSRKSRTPTRSNPEKRSTRRSFSTPPTERPASGPRSTTERSSAA